MMLLYHRLLLLRFPPTPGVSVILSADMKCSIKLSCMDDAFTLPLIIKLIADIDAYPIVIVTTVTNTNSIICSLFFI